VAERVGGDLYYSGHLFRGAARARARAVSARPSRRGAPLREHDRGGSGGAGRRRVAGAPGSAAVPCAARCGATAPRAAHCAGQRRVDGAPARGRAAPRRAAHCAGQPLSAANTTHLDRRGLSPSLAPAPRRERAVTASIAGRRPAHSSNVHSDEGSWWSGISGLFLFFQNNTIL